MKSIAKFKSTRLKAIPIDFGTCIKSRAVKVVTGPVEFTADNNMLLSSVDKIFRNGGLVLNVLTLLNDEISQGASARLMSRESCLRITSPLLLP